MKALKYTGLKPGQHTTINDARSVEDWYETQNWDEKTQAIVTERCEPDAEGARHHFCDGEYIRINPGDIVPLDRFQNSPHSGDVAKIHTTPLFGADGALARGPLAQLIDLDEAGAEIASGQGAPAPSPFRRRAAAASGDGASASTEDEKKSS